MPTDLAEFLTPAQVDDRVDALIASHNADPTAHNLDEQIAALSTDQTILKRRIRVPLGYDHFNRANGALAASTLPVGGQAWRNALGSTTAVITSNKAGSSGGNAIAMFDLPGHQLGGVTVLSATLALGTGDGWLFAWFSEGTPSGVVCQRGSDRIRVGTQLGGAITWAQEYLINGSGTTDQLTLSLNADTRTATVQVGGVTIINAVALPAITWGASVGIRAAGNATLDEFVAAREVLL